MTVSRLLSGLLMVILAASSAVAQEVASGPVADLLEPVCSIIDATARSNALPIDFFTRLIWQESRFHPDLVGPMTRSGGHAEGIAQFMPATATERGLFEPFNPAVALPKSAEFLAELRQKFGNLGFAAGAYNAGPQRMRDFLAGSRGLPSETRRYVIAITGRSIEEWAASTQGQTRAAQDTDESQHRSGSPTCREVAARLEREPFPSLPQWQGQAVPAWCKGLQHPNLEVCGPVHLIRPSMQMASATTHISHASSRSLPR